MYVYVYGVWWRQFIIFFKQGDDANHYIATNKNETRMSMEENN